eukprot:g755.t1
MGVPLNFGQNVQKYAMLKNEEKPESERASSYTQQPLWWCGLLLVILGSLGDFTSLSFAPQSVVMPVGSVTLVANLFFASMWLGETLTRKDLKGTLMIIGGATLVAVSYGVLGESNERTYTLQQLIELYLRVQILIYFVFVGALMFFLYSLMKRCEFILGQDGDHTRDPEYMRLARWHPFSYSALSGTFGANSVLFAKSTTELIRLTAQGENQFFKPLTYMIIACMFTCIALQTHFLAHGLQFFDALYIIPVFQCFFITFSIFGGAVYFNELATFSALQWLVFLFACALTLAGVVVLSAREMKPAYSGEELHDDEGGRAGAGAGAEASPTVRRPKEAGGRGAVSSPVAARPPSPSRSSPTVDVAEAAAAAAATSGGGGRRPTLDSGELNEFEKIWATVSGAVDLSLPPPVVKARGKSIAVDSRAETQRRLRHRSSFVAFLERPFDMLVGRDEEGGAGGGAGDGASGGAPRRRPSLSADAADAGARIQGGRGGARRALGSFSNSSSSSFTSASELTAAGPISPARRRQRVNSVAYDAASTVGMGVSLFALAHERATGMHAGNDDALLGRRAASELDAGEWDMDRLTSQWVKDDATGRIMLLDAFESEDDLNKVLHTNYGWDLQTLSQQKEKWALGGATVSGSATVSGAAAGAGGGATSPRAGPASPDEYTLWEWQAEKKKMMGMLSGKVWKQFPAAASATLSRAANSAAARVQLSKDIDGVNAAVRLDNLRVTFADDGGGAGRPIRAPRNTRWQFCMLPAADAAAGGAARGPAAPQAWVAFSPDDSRVLDTARLAHKVIVCIHKSKDPTLSDYSLIDCTDAVTDETGDHGVDGDTELSIDSSTDLPARARAARLTAGELKALIAASPKVRYQDDGRALSSYGLYVAATQLHGSFASSVEETEVQDDELPLAPDHAIEDAPAPAVSSTGGADAAVVVRGPKVQHQGRIRGFLTADGAPNGEKLQAEVLGELCVGDQLLSIDGKHVGEGAAFDFDGVVERLKEHGRGAPRKPGSEESALDVVMRECFDGGSGIELLDRILQKEYGCNLYQFSEFKDEAPQGLGSGRRVFLKFAPFLKMYVFYANAHEKAAGTIASWMVRYSAVSSFVEQTKAQTNGQDMLALLIEPIQRIPRYEMLLKAMQKNTVSGHADQKALNEAYGEVKKIAARMNSSLQDAVRNLKVLEIQDCLRPKQELVKPGRSFVHEGTLTKIGRKREQLRMIWLFTDVVVCGQTSGHNVFRHKCTIEELQDVSPSGSGDDDRTFTISGKPRALTLRAKSRGERDDWIMRVKGCLGKTRKLSEVHQEAGAAESRK